MPTTANLSLPAVAPATPAASAAAAVNGPAAAQATGPGASFAELFDLTLALAGAPLAAGDAAPAAAAGQTGGNVASLPALLAGDGKAAVAPVAGKTDRAGKDAHAPGAQTADKDSDATATSVNPLAAALAALLPVAAPHPRPPAVAAGRQATPGTPAAVAATPAHHSLAAVGAHLAARVTPAAAEQPAPAAKIAAAGQPLPAAAPDKASSDGVTAPTGDAAPTGVPLVPLAARSDSPPVQLTVAAPLQSSAWGPELGQKVMWMVGQNVPSASLHLNPAHLGPVQVQLTVTGNQVNALIVAHHEQTREAIQAALPQLRATLAGSGLALGQAQVGAGGSGAHSGAGQWTPPQQDRSPLVTPVRIGRNGPVLAGLSAVNGVDTFA